MLMQLEQIGGEANESDEEARVRVYQASQSQLLRRVACSRDEISRAVRSARPTGLFATQTISIHVASKTSQFIFVDSCVKKCNTLIEILFVLFS